MRAAAGFVMLVLIAGAGVAAADPLGRLFSTPEERARLDAIRNDPDFGKPPPAAEPEARASTPAEPAAPQVPQVEVSGVVIRSDGRNTAWINGHEVAAGEPSPEGVRVRMHGAGRISIELPGGEKTIPLKPGQRIDVARGSVVDAYERRPEADAPSAFTEAPPAAPQAAPAGEAASGDASSGDRSSESAPVEKPARD